MKTRRLVRLHDTPDEAWLVTGDPLPPPSGRCWQSPAHHARCHHRPLVWPDERFYWTFLDPTVTP